MSTLTNVFKQNVSSCLPDFLTIAFEVRTTSEAHYVAAFSTHCIRPALDYCSLLLAVSTIKYETMQHTDEHVFFLKFYKCVSEKLK